MKVFIPAAGRGTRVSQHAPAKPLITLQGKPLIWHIFDFYPEGTNFVVAVGYKSELVSQAIEAYRDAFPTVNIQMINTDSFGEGTLGLTQTLLDAQHLLQEEFIFHAVDTVLAGGNWLPRLLEERDSIICARTTSPGMYRVLRDTALLRTSLESGGLAYVGVAHIYDTESFWKPYSSVDARSVEEGEAIGLNSLKIKELNPQDTIWYDMGSEKSMQVAHRAFQSEDHVLPKSEEAIWHHSGKMYKFHTSQKFISDRLERSKALAPFVPNCSRIGDNLFSYTRIPGRTLSDCSSNECFVDFLSFAKKFWSSSTVTKAEHSPNYELFYKEKTLQRIQAYLLKKPLDSEKMTVGGCELPSIFEALSKIVWHEVTTPLIGLCHGDMHTENIIHNHSDNAYTFLDWRQDIAGDTSGLGDIYYDLGKLLHGLLVDHEVVSAGKFSVVEKSDSTLSLRIHVRPNKREWVHIFTNWAIVEGYDLSKIWTMCGLIFLNIATLHHDGYDRFLFLLGRLVIGLARESTNPADLVMNLLTDADSADTQGSNSTK